MYSLSRTPLLLLFLLFLLFLPSLSSSKNANLDFQSFSFHNLTLLGDSFLRNGSIGLTRDTIVPASSSGTACFNIPIQFHDPHSNLSTSFSTNFTFLITNPNPESYGDGVTFFISPFNLTLGATGGFLGLFNSSLQIKNGSLIAIEFDTKMDEGLNDPSENHVGFDVNSPVSVKVGDLDPFSVIDLKSGNPITAWIDYFQDDGSLIVFLSGGTNKPKNSVMSLALDLSPHFTEWMYVGFSASTEGSTELHTILNWSFQTFGLPSVNNSDIRNNVSETTTWKVNPAMPITNSTGHVQKKLSFALVILVPIVFAVLFVVIIWLSIKKSTLVESCKTESKPEFLKGPRKFSYREICSATKGFHSSRIVGNGAFGTVYRATDPKSGVSYAVKRSKQAHESLSEFTGELNIIAELRHKNLVQLQGWCTEKNELLLTYEFMPNGSLDKILYHRAEMGPNSALNWAHRYNTAVGLASVLAYLHRECDQRVIHRDIKTSNIMLDADFNPRLGDFGLARLMDHNKSPVSTLTAGTMGYLAPEYLQYGKYTEKTDIFSYGVVVLEVCCGRRPIDKEGEGKESKMVNLVDWVWRLYGNDRIMEAVDKRLNGEFDRDDMMRLLLLGLSCVNPNCEERPSMRRVLQILNHESEPLVVPRVKPLLLLTSSNHLNLLEIVSDNEESAGSRSLYEVKIV